MSINTAVGVQRVPQDYMNVARVFNLLEWKIIRKILFPSVLPCMLTWVRLAIGTAWLAIVAEEMFMGWCQYRFLSLGWNALAQQRDIRNF